MSVLITPIIIILVNINLIYGIEVSINKTTTNVTNNNNDIILDTTHMGRENVKNLVKTTNTLPLPTVPPYDQPEKNDNKKSVPKKGVGPPQPVSSATTLITRNDTQITANITKATSATASTVTNITTVNFSTTAKPKKPLFTEIDHENPPAASNKESEKILKPNNIPTLDFDQEQQEKKRRRADYIVPIVAVILSVPLVAIVISVLYKRASEWWQHRHYRRMDFLIEGMYNS